MLALSPNQSPQENSSFCLFLKSPPDFTAPTVVYITNILITRNRCGANSVLTEDPTITNVPEKEKVQLHVLDPSIQLEKKVLINEVGEPKMYNGKLVALDEGTPGPKDKFVIHMENPRNPDHWLPLPIKSGEKVTKITIAYHLTREFSVYLKSPEGTDGLTTIEVNQPMVNRSLTNHPMVVDEISETGRVNLYFINNPLVDGHLQDTINDTTIESVTISEGDKTFNGKLVSEGKDRSWGEWFVVQIQDPSNGRWIPLPIKSGDKVTKITVRYRV